MSAKPSFSKSVAFNVQLLEVLGLSDRCITDLTLTCKAGETTTVQYTEQIVGDRCVDTISRTLDLVERDSEVGKSINPPLAIT